MLATTICDQQDALEALGRRYDEQVASSSAQLAHLMRSHEARMAQELGQAKVHVDVANDRVKASDEAQAQLLLQDNEEEEEAQDLEQRRRAAVVAQPSERRNRRLENETSRIELRGVTVTRENVSTPRGY